MQSVKQRITVRLRRCFLTGVLILLPAAVTIWFLWRIFALIDGKLLRHVAELQSLLPYSKSIVTLIILKVLILVALFLLISLAGLVARNVLGRRLITYGEKILARVPLVSKVYLTVQQISSAFLGEERTTFNRVVLLEYPRAGLYSLGLVSSRSRGEVQDRIRETVLNVFIPTTPNPTSGLLIMVPEKDTIPLRMTVEEALKFLISGGAVEPIYISEKKDAL